MTWNTPPDEQFEREHGCTEAEWRRWLPGAVRAHELLLGVAAEARVQIGNGVLQMRWLPLPPRRIALVVLPRLRVAYCFSGVPPAARQTFMRYFDLYLQRGGG